MYMKIVESGLITVRKLLQKTDVLMKISLQKLKQEALKVLFIGKMTALSVGKI